MLGPQLIFAGRGGQMAIRDKLRDNAAPFAPPGEQVEAVIPAQTASQWWIALALIVFLILNRYRMIVVTPTQIAVLDCGRWRAIKPKSVVTVVPRAALGPPQGVIFHKVTIGDETLRVHRRFFDDIRKVG
jgi:hypothetical protein